MSSFADKYRPTIMTLIEIENLIVPYDKEMPLQRLELFFAIADKSGMSMTEAAKEIGRSLSCISRNAAILSNKGWNNDSTKKPTNGLGLIIIKVDHGFPLTKRLYLSAKGKRLVNESVDIILKYKQNA